MNKVSMWVKTKRAGYYRKRMDQAMKNHLDAEAVGASELGMHWYQKYLAYKSKYKKLGWKKQN